MPTISYAWAPITKSEKNDDGTITVYGPAASSALDRDNQRLDGAWLDAAMPRWLAEGGGVREQHDPKRAVGVGVGLSKGDDGAHYLTAMIVDPIAVKKIEHGVLRGFSVGIKNPRIEMGKAEAPNGLVTAGDVIEVSVCDRPANGECIFTLAKADEAGDLQAVQDAHVVEKSGIADTFGLLPELYERLATPVKDALAALAAGGAQVSAEVGKSESAEGGEVPVVVNVIVKADDADLAKAYSAADRKRMADTGAALSDGSFPIKTKADLRRAIKAVGRGGADHDEIRAHIATRAKALGLEAMVPDNWNADGSLKDAEKADAATVEKAEEVLRSVRALTPDLAKAEDGNGDAEQPDIDGATAAIAAIAALIISEAESLAKGNLNEACDIALLLQAVEALKWFSVREANEDDGSDGTDMSLAEDPELTKAGKKGNLAPPFKKKEPAAAGDADDEDTDGEDDEKPAPKAKKAAAKSDDGDLLTKADAQAAIDAAVAHALAAMTAETSPAHEPESVTKADLADMVKAAVAKATAAAEERTDALAADLAKATGDLEAMKQMPIPGGPVLMRTAGQQDAATKADAEGLRAQAAELLNKAEQFSSNRDLAQGYRDRAKALLDRAAA